LEGIQTNDAFESEKLHKDLVWLQIGLHTPVEPEDCNKSDSSAKQLEHADPNMCKVPIIGCCAIYVYCQRDAGRNPNNDAGWNELKYEVPDALFTLSAARS